jgi:hypothetical protein
MYVCMYVWSRVPCRRIGPQMVGNDMMRVLFIPRDLPKQENTRVRHHPSCQQLVEIANWNFIFSSISEGDEWSTIPKGSNLWKHFVHQPGSGIRYHNDIYPSPISGMVVTGLQNGNF